MHQIHCTTKLYKVTRKYQQCKDLESNLNEMYEKPPRWTVQNQIGYYNLKKKDISIAGIYFKL